MHLQMNVTSSNPEMEKDDDTNDTMEDNSSEHTIRLRSVTNLKIRG
jgi:hypothetical protein